MNSFLSKTRDDPTLKPDDFALVVVRSREGRYEDEEALPVFEGVFNSPFKGRDLVDCHRILSDIRRETSPGLDDVYFVVMDEHSIKEETVLIVEADEESVSKERVAFETANALLLARFAGFGSWPVDLIVTS